MDLLSYSVPGPLWLFILVRLRDGTSRFCAAHAGEEALIMRVTTTDPISGNDVVDVDDTPPVVGANGDEALKIYVAATVTVWAR